ncbi:GNAT family N-acetyltransferase [Reyranella sp.]|uniref:GNAT family N-acetyltransferase n=1 Tax=Reyranella sp. TaxID=1929291 RepID=UPI003BA944D9
MSSLKIIPLAERPDLVGRVVAWGYAEWGHLDPTSTLPERERRVRASLHVDCVPCVFIALDPADSLVGTASLVLDDLEGDPRNPWLASVFVPVEARRRGVASALVRACEAAARQFGHRRLYLFTASAPALYARLGWRRLERLVYRGEHIQVMDKAL